MHRLHLRSDVPDRDIWLILDLSLRNAGFGFSSLCVGFVVDKVAGFFANNLSFLWKYISKKKKYISSTVTEIVVKYS
jgi:hypothetical protein